MSSIFFRGVMMEQGGESTFQQIIENIEGATSVHGSQAIVSSDTDKLLFEVPVTEEMYNSFDADHKIVYDLYQHKRKELEKSLQVGEITLGYFHKQQWLILIDFVREVKTVEDRNWWRNSLYDFLQITENLGYHCPNINF
jgi:hypothetical protein